MFNNLKINLELLHQKFVECHLNNNLDEFYNRYYKVSSSQTPDGIFYNIKEFVETQKLFDFYKMKDELIESIDKNRGKHN
mgnify:CR=1 FL=1